MNQYISVVSISNMARYIMYIIYIYIYIYTYNTDITQISDSIFEVPSRKVIH